MMEDQAQAAAARVSNPALSSADAMAKAEAGQLPPAQATPAELQRVEQARQAQQRAEEALTMAAERLAQGGRALADAAKKPADPRPGGRSGAKPSVPVESQDLAQSFAQASGAAKAADSAQAAAQARQAAQALSQMARQAAQNLGGMSDLAGPGPAEPNHGEPGKEGAVTPASRGAEMRQGQNVAGDGVPPELAKMGISVADWTRIKGALGSEATNQAASGAPKEYRDLVSDYFRIIATEAGK